MFDYLLAAGAGDLYCKRLAGTQLKFTRWDSETALLVHCESPKNKWQ